MATTAQRGEYRTIRLGVIGLGRLWEVRHKPSLAALADRFRVAAVYDQVARRAELEARQLGCEASESLRALFHRDEIDAYLLASPQWFGFYPLTLACLAGKPAYCAWNAAEDPEAFEKLAVSLRDQHPKSQVVFELARRRYPATLRLRQLFAGELGRPLTIAGINRLFGFDRNALPGPASQMAPSSLTADPGGYLLDWLRCLMDGEPSQIRAVVVKDSDGRPNPDFLSIHASYDQSAFAHVAVIRHPTRQSNAIREVLPSPGFEIQTERGTAWVELPDRVRWSVGDRVHDERLAADPPVGVQLLQAFHELVTEAAPSWGAPGWDDALSIARMAIALRHGSQE